MNLEKGLVLPQNIEIEKAVLSAMMISAEGLNDVLSVIGSPEVFYNDQHKAVCEAVMSLYVAGNPVDMLTVSAELKRLGQLERAGGDLNLIKLTQQINSAAHAEYHARILLQKHMARQVINFSTKIINVAYDDSTDIFELLQRWQKEFDNVMDFVNTGRTTMSFAAALQHLKEEVQLLTANKEEVKLVGVDTGFQNLNKYTGGYRPQDLVVVAARPGMGKTSYVLKCAVENLKKGNAVGFISLEMSIEQLTARAVAIDTNFHLKQLLKSGFEHVEYFNTYTMHQERMNSYAFVIDDSGKTDISDIVIMAKMWKRKNNIQLLIVDYLQLMTDRSVKGNREGEIASISRRLKRLAKELNIPIMALSQLSRQVETRGHSKRPMLSDLRESGAIEQDADMVQFIYRPEYYKIDLDESDYDERSWQLIQSGANSEIIIAKYRGGSTNTAMLKWIGDKTKFVDVEDPSDKGHEQEERTALPMVTPEEAFGNDGFTKDNPF